MYVLPIRNTFVLPGMQKSICATRQVSVNGLLKASAGGQILILTQRDQEAQPSSNPEDYFPQGVIATVMQLTINLQQQGWDLVVEAQQHVELNDLAFVETEHGLALEGSFTPTETIPVNPALFETLREELRALSESRDGDIRLREISHDLDERYPDVQVLEYLHSDWKDLKEVSAMLDVNDRISFAIDRIRHQRITDEVNQETVRKADQNIQREHRRHVLNERIKVLQSELGQDNKLRERIETAELPEQIRTRLLGEYDRITRSGALAQEGAVLREYIETALSIPWLKKASAQDDLNVVSQILNESHYGMDDVKTRILEITATSARLRRAGRNSSGKVILLLGAPGIGKTSIAAAIAKATGRPLARVALGGLSDEAELRGHRRTYVGAMPGRIIKAMINAKVNNPVMLLDEIDKLGSENATKGDPQSALLEILDPSQHTEFRDRYLDEGLDLSDVTFIATANSLRSISGPLRDRMEIIELPSYTFSEKRSLLRDWLWPRALEANAAPALTLTTDAQDLLITQLTREAGVRHLTRLSDRLITKASLEAERGGELDINAERAAQLLGDEGRPRESKLRGPTVGAAQGLYYSEASGGLLVIETDIIDGTGKVTSSGQLGNVMKESLEIAWRLARRMTQRSGTWPSRDLHVHLPDGATPKDGPSAGAALVVAMISALQDRPARADIAMTGEVNLRGDVTAVGGIREKVAGAVREGIHTVILPSENRPDAMKLPQELLADVQLIFVDNVTQVLNVMLPEETAAERGIIRDNSTEARA